MHLRGICLIHPHAIHEDTDALRKTYNWRNAEATEAKIRLERASNLVAQADTWKVFEDLSH
jgi:hypothetical protein